MLMKCAGIICLLAIVLPAWSLAAQPEIVTISPPGLLRGATTEIKITGARLADVHQILFHPPQGREGPYEPIQVKDLRSESETVMRVALTVPADYPCDLHPFRIVTKSGISNLRLLSVSSLPIVDEKEPNNNFAEPQVIPTNVTIHGLTKTEDVDYFAVDLKKDQVIQVEMEGLRLSYMSDFFDPFVAIYNPERFELSRSDDHPLVQQDCVCSFQAPGDGRYVIEVRESSFGGNDRAQYRLHIGDFPRPVAAMPSGGPPGKPLDVVWIDQQGNRWNETIQLPDNPLDSFRVWAGRDGRQAPTPNYLRVNHANNVLESGDNNDPNQVAARSDLPVAFNGVLESQGDVDWFGVSAKKGQTLEIKALARNVLRSPVDGVLMIRKVGGGQLAANDDTSGPDGFVSFKVPEDGNYAVGIKDHLGNFGPQYVYRIEVRLPEPSVETNIAEQERYLSQTIPVPQGARMAVNVDLVRKFVGGEGKLSIPNLPEGMRMEDVTVAADLGSRVILLDAAADAALQGKLVDLTATLQATPELRLLGHLNQRSQIIRGQNNRDVWGINSNQLAVAIVEAAPFDIQVDPPLVPLVRSGSLDLRVRLQRREGFDKVVSLRMLNPPPGVSASGSIKFDPNQTEVLLPLTANGNARFGTWPITLIGTSETGRGRVRLASPLVPLDVADSWFDFKFHKTVTEQGKATDIVVGVKAKRELPGAAEIEVLGLPPGTVSNHPKLTFAAGTDRLAFPLSVPSETRAGNFKTVVCRVTISTDKGIITQTTGTGEIQIDVPLPKPAGTETTAASTTSTSEKPLSRLEQLRQEREAARGK
jgi:hypothetical protein